MDIVSKHVSLFGGTSMTAQGFKVPWSNEVKARFLRLLRGWGELSGCFCAQQVI